MPNESMRILVVDDNPEDQETYRRYLRRDSSQSYEIATTNGVEAGLAALATAPPDCIILDYSMPDGTGLDFLREYQARGADKETAVIMLTGTGDENIAVQAMKSGARDYLLKGSLTAEHLRIAIKGAIFRMQTEQQLNAQRRELERLYAEAQEAHVAKDALVAQLRDANSAKDHFLATLSHELRTPLTPILMAVSSMPTEGLSEEVRDGLQMIRRNAALEARLIDDLLDLTRVTKGKLNLTLRPANLHHILLDVIEICRGDFEERSMPLTLNLRANACFVHADPARLQQVFWNLLKNAAKFTPLGGSVSVTTNNPAPDRVAIQVTDTGLGIHPERLGKIFNAFEQGSAAMTQQFGGLGLGLTISKALVDAHNGVLRAESPGSQQGSTFIVELAASDDQPAAGDVLPRHTNGQSARILLVEDHEDTARLLSRALERRGFCIVHAASIAAAIATFQQEEIDLIVSDLGLPDGHGTEMLAKAKAIRPVKAIALSGYGHEHDIVQSRAAGFALHLVKPVDVETLQGAIERMLALTDVAVAS